MTQDEIIEMAREASLNVTYIGDTIGLSYAQIAHFAKLVAAKEREACAKLCEKQMEDSPWFIEAAAAIRARGEA